MKLYFLVITQWKFSDDRKKKNQKLAFLSLQIPSTNQTKRTSAAGEQRLDPPLPSLESFRVAQPVKIKSRIRFKQ